MNKLFGHSTAASAATLILSLAAGNVQAGELEMAAGTPDATVSTRPAGRNFMRLPGLVYDFAIRASCREGLQPQSVSLSIADTRITLGPGRLADEQPINVAVKVPAAQISPVALDRFCVRDPGDDTAADSSPVRIPAVLSAQGALLCADESSSEMIYASASLDVNLHCQQETETESRTLD